MCLSYSFNKRYDDLFFTISEHRESIGSYTAAAIVFADF